MEKEMVEILGGRGHDNGPGASHGDIRTTSMD